MERTHRPARSTRSTRRRSCFNPCCDGTDSSTGSFTSAGTGGEGVSILVVMERTHRQAMHVSYPQLGVVSILVVMERTHRLLALASGDGCEQCFNPCCDGTDSSTRRFCIFSLLRRRGFNPCCDGTDSSTYSGSIVHLSVHECFNPCCDGTDSSTAVARAVAKARARFQSLL